MTLEFSVFGVPQPKGNMRAINVRGMKQPIVTDSNKSAKSWAQLVAQGASDALHRLPKEDRAIIVTGARVRLGFYLPRPKKYHAARYRGVPLQHTTRPDVDKLTRSILDALTGVLWTDDGCVTDLVVSKRYADIYAPARVDVRVEHAPMATPGELDTLPLDLSLDLVNPQEAQ